KVRVDELRQTVGLHGWGAPKNRGIGHREKGLAMHRSERHPVATGDDGSFVRSSQDRRRQQPMPSPPEYELSPSATDFGGRREPERPLDQPMVEKRWTILDTVGHRTAVLECQYRRQIRMPHQIEEIA